MNRVPPTFSSVGAGHNPELWYQDQDPEGKIRTYFTVHPAGNRKVRRYRQRHHPYFTKSRHKGRDWWRMMHAQES